MDNFIVMLREAFNESANYLTWSFYALLAAYISMAFLSMKRNKNKITDKIGKAIFGIFIVTILLPNLMFIVLVFSQKLGTVAGVISFVIAIFMLIINTAPVLLSMKEDKNQETESK